MTEAREWWANRKLMRYYQEAQPWTPDLVAAILEGHPKRVVELGCNVGRNLRAIANEDPGVQLVGVDVNAEAVAWGRRKWGLDLRLGDDSLLEPDAYDVAFTVSVLDHMPDPARALTALAAAAPRLLLLEPWIGVEGPAKSRNPYTWSWDYATRLRGMGWRVTSRKFPIGPDYLGPDYRLYRATRPVEVVDDTGGETT